MKSKNSVLSVFIVMAFLAAVCTIVFVITWTDSPDSAAVKIAYDAFPSAKTPSPGQESKENPVLDSRNKETPARIENATTEIPLPAANPGDLMQRILIQDELGTPIIKGKITVDGKEYEFKEGQIDLPEPTLHKNRISVTSEGYSPLNQIDYEFLERSQFILGMQYTMDFTIQAVGNEKTASATDTRIRLWKGKEPNRPPQESATFSYAGRKSLYEFWLNNNNGEYRIRQVPQNNWGDNHENIIQPGSKANPLLGDRLASIGNCPWVPGEKGFFWSEKFADFSYLFFPLLKQNSTKLRIIDTLSFLDKTIPQYFNDISEICDIDREGTRVCYFLQFPAYLPSGTFIQDVTVDENGKCNFRDLPPALYYAQAYNQNCKSMLFPIHPCCGGGIVRLEQNSQVKIIVKRAGFNDPDYGAMDNVQIQLKAQYPPNSIYIAETKNGGRATFNQGIPYGDYSLVVLPSDGNGITQKIIVDEPKEIFTVYIEGWKTYSLSGIVTEKETNTAVEGFELNLFTADNSGWDKQIEVQKTDANGKFKFSNLIPNHYRITGTVSDSGDFLFLPSGISTSEYIISLKNNPSNLEFDLVDADIENINYQVSKVIKTRFSGKVVYPDGTPFSGSKLIAKGELMHNSIITFPNNPVSGPDGSFDFFIATCDPYAQKNIHNFVITSMLGKMHQPEWKAEYDQSGNVSYTASLENLYAADWIGSVTCSGNFGIHYGNLIIINQKKQTKTLYGKLMAQDIDPSAYVIHVFQNGIQLSEIVKEDGTFTVENMDEGPFTITIEGIKNTIIHTPFQEQDIIKYARGIYPLIMPQDKDKMFVELPLTRAGYFWGIVKDKQGVPMKNVQFVLIQDRDNRDIDIYHTTAAGFFFLGNILVTGNESYRIEGMDPDTRRKKTILRGIKPNLENMEIIF